MSDRRWPWTDVNEAATSCRRHGKCPIWLRRATAEWYVRKRQVRPTSGAEYMASARRSTSTTPYTPPRRPRFPR